VGLGYGLCSDGDLVLELCDCLFIGEFEVYKLGDFLLLGGAERWTRGESDADDGCDGLMV
jgi:hypothetical protein